MKIGKNWLIPPACEVFDTYPGFTRSSREQAHVGLASAPNQFFSTQIYLNFRLHL